MVVRLTLLAAALLVAAGASARGQDADEVKRLKERIELLEARLKLAEKENEALKKGLAQPRPGAAAPAGDDLFAVGAYWKGERHYAVGNGKDAKRGEWELRVARREKATFEGELILHQHDGEKYVAKVTGAVPAGKEGAFSMKSEKKGFFQQTFTGRVKGGEVGVTFTGTTQSGSAISGRGTLLPRN